ncbi:MAG TPA: cupin domain-containing protein [Thermoanaerobaculia bacterium]|jgi:quercetin dioxygenase-like cupin family protein|nr:cupin domain-containing protein [Thermoanaerobaculia bacterium]
MLKRWIQTLAFPVLFLVAAALLAPRAEAAEAKSPQKGAKKFVAWPAADLKWEALAGAPPGPMLATLWGDPTKGAYGAIEKFPAGFSVPLHTHPADHKIVIISGTWIHSEDGQPEVRLGAGSYLFQPANRKHTTACDAASECLFFIESNGKFGVKMVEEKKTPAK